MTLLTPIACCLIVVAGGTLVTGGPSYGERSRYELESGNNRPPQWYQPSNRTQLVARVTPTQRRHHRRTAHGGYPAKASYSKPYHNEVDLWSSQEERKLTSGVYRTYGKGSARIPYLGATAHAPNQMGHRKAHRGTITTRVIIPEPEPSVSVVSRSRRDCSGCPDDHTVVATRGSTFVILPEPCSTLKWSVISGPRPGTKIREGRHYLVGRLGHRKKICQYQYNVLVRHCPPLHGDDLDVSCTADDTWGSTCTVACLNNKTMVGTSQLECTDKLTWSAPLPKCTEIRGCPMPHVPDNTKTSCQTRLDLELNNDLLPEGTECRFTTKGRETVVRCEGGGWSAVDEAAAPRAKDKYLYRTEDEVERSPCDPNPCHRGGTCLQAPRADARPICICKSGTQGPRCELQQCEANVCLNGGQCLILAGQMTCYCPHNYTGSRCDQPLVHRFG